MAISMLCILNEYDIHTELHTILRSIKRQLSFSISRFFSILLIFFPLQTTERYPGKGHTTIMKVIILPKNDNCDWSLVL